MFSAVLRGVGDSVHSFLFVLIASVANVMLCIDRIKKRPYHIAVRRLQRTKTERGEHKTDGKFAIVPAGVKHNHYIIFDGVAFFGRTYIIKM